MCLCAKMLLDAAAVLITLCLCIWTASSIPGVDFLPCSSETLLDLNEVSDIQNLPAPGNKFIGFGTCRDLARIRVRPCLFLVRL